MNAGTIPRPVELRLVGSDTQEEIGGRVAGKRRGGVGISRRRSYKPVGATLL